MCVSSSALLTVSAAGGERGRGGRGDLRTALWSKTFSHLLPSPHLVPVFNHLLSSGSRPGARICDSLESVVVEDAWSDVNRDVSIKANLSRKSGFALNDFVGCSWQDRVV